MNAREEKRLSEAWHLEQHEMIRTKFNRAAIYVRVSTADQDLEQQRKALERYAKLRGWKVGEVYEEKVSGAARRRPELERMKRDASMKRFDVLLFWSISRLGRDLLETLKLARWLFEEKRVALVSYTQAAIDLSTTHGKLVLAVFGAIAEGQRDELIAATKRGMAAARARGVKIGRPRKNLNGSQVAWIVKHNSVAFAAKAFGCSRSTIQRVMARRPVPRQPVGNEIGANLKPLAQNRAAASTPKSRPTNRKHPTP